MDGMSDQEEEVPARGHALSQAIAVLRGRKHQYAHVSQRQAMLMTTRPRDDGLCRICGGTGVFDPGQPAAIFDETYGGQDGASIQQVRDWIAWVLEFCVPVPCFNPGCLAPRPSSVCPACRGFGQEYFPNRTFPLGDRCERCLGFGFVR